MIGDNEFATETPGTAALQKLTEELRDRLDNSEGNNELLQEQLAELELALEDVGWLRMSAYGDREFSVPGLKKLRRLARLSYLKNPLVKNAVNVQTNYVWGQGCSITANDEQVNEVIQRFLDDPKNTVSFTGHTARMDCEREQQVQGDQFLALFTNKRTGRVIVRSIYPDEIADIITNPNDYREPWFYKRVWSEREFSPAEGVTGSQEKIVYYPDWRLTYNRDPDVPKPEMIGSCPVIWDAPVYHIKTGGFGDMKFGVPEIYSALDWARAVKEDLEAYATQKQALARFAWKMQTKGGKAGVAAGKKKLGSTLNADGAGMLEKNPPPTSASTFIGAEGWTMDPIKLAGTTISPEEGHRMWLMVAAGVGLPETILAGNADSGNLATAKTLDRPTELKMQNRQQFWSDIYLDILGYVIDQVAMSPMGDIHGTLVLDEWNEEATVELDGDLDRQIDIQFPSILQRDDVARVNAVVQAATLGNPATGNAGLLDDETITGLLLNALGEDDIDETLAELYPGNDLSFSAGRGLNKPEEQGMQSMINDTGDMGDAGGADYQGGFITPPSSSAAMDLAVIASMRNFAEALKPLFEKEGMTVPDIPMTGVQAALVKNKRSTKKGRSGITTRVRKATQAEAAKPKAVAL